MRRTIEDRFWLRATASNVCLITEAVLMEFRGELLDDEATRIEAAS